MQGNIPKLYVSNFLSGLVFWYAIEKLFMVSIGITPFGVSINAVVLVIVTSLFDVPFGVMADRWSRKYTLALGAGALGVASLIAGSSHTLLMYTVGTGVYGLYLCLTDGTYQAITYDSLREMGKEALYAKHQGGSYGMFMAGIALSSPIGGFLSRSYGYRSTYYISAAVCVISLVVVLSMREPTFHKVEAKTKLRHHISTTAHTIFSNKTVLYLSSILLVTGMLRSSLNEYAGLYFIAVGFGAIGSGWANGGKWLFGAIGQVLAARLARTFPYMLGIFFVAFLGMSSWRTPLGLIFFYLCTFSYGIVLNQSQALIQSHVDSGLRATTLSLINFGTSAVMIPLGLAFGWLAERYNVFVAYQMFATIGILYCMVWLFWKRHVDVRPVQVVSSGDIPDDQRLMT